MTRCGLQLDLRPYNPYGRSTQASELASERAQSLGRIGGYPMARIGTWKMSTAPTRKQLVRRFSHRWSVWRVNDDGEGWVAESKPPFDPCRYRNLTAEAAKLIAGALRDEQTDDDCQRWTFLAGLSVPHALTEAGRMAFACSH